VEPKKKMKQCLVITAAVAVVWMNSSSADWTEARCDIYPKGEDHVSKMIPCTFGQHQGNVTITRDDDVTHQLSAVGDTPGNFLDQDGHPAYRQSGLGDQGLIFRLEDESVYIYWNTAALYPQEEDNLTTPFTTADYDATTLLSCRAPGESEFGLCPAGILRMEKSQASIVVQNQSGEQFTINFMTDSVNATNREIEAVLEDDTWTVTVANGEVYQVPRAAIEGG
jgi:hypothetical protein